MRLIQIPISFINHLQNVTITFDDLADHYRKRVLLTVSENKNLNMNPKSWEYQHVLQANNMIEFTSLESGNYYVAVQSMDEESIDNPFKVSITGKTFEFERMIKTDDQKLNLSITNLQKGVNDLTASRKGGGGGMLSTTGSFTLSGGQGGGQSGPD